MAKIPTFLAKMTTFLAKMPFWLRGRAGLAVLTVSQAVLTNARDTADTGFS